MSDPALRALELSIAGYGCSQILVQLHLDARRGDNPELLRAVSALHGGLGQSGRLCGALTGGGCVLALHAGRGSPAEAEDPRLVPMIRTLIDWFEQEIGRRWGGVDCADILEGDDGNRLARCPEIVLGVHRKLQEILAAEGFEQPSGGG